MSEHGIIQQYTVSKPRGLTLAENNYWTMSVFIFLSLKLFHRFISHYLIDLFPLHPEQSFPSLLSSHSYTRTSTPSKHCHHFLFKDRHPKKWYLNLIEKRKGNRHLGWFERRKWVAETVRKGNKRDQWWWGQWERELEEVGDISGTS